MADARASFVVGEWDDALPALVAGGQAAQEKGHPLLLSQSLAFRVVIATATGDLAAARELAAGLSPWRTGDALAYNGGLVASALAGLMVAEGDRRGAYDLLLAVLALPAPPSTTASTTAPSPPTSCASGWSSATVTSPPRSRMPSRPGSRWPPGCRASAAWHCAAGGSSTATWSRSSRRSPSPAEGPSSRSTRGPARTRRDCWPRAGRTHDAAALLTEALELHERAGADAWAGRVRSQLRRLGVHVGSRGPRHRPTAGWESLTTTEHAVSLLVAEGLTNGAVARRLYISPHTVNTHLRHVFGKLGISNRVALAGVVHHSIE